MKAALPVYDQAGPIEMPVADSRKLLFVDNECKPVISFPALRQAGLRNRCRLPAE